MAAAIDRPPFLGSWRRIYLAVLLNLIFWIAMLAAFTMSFEPAP